MPYRRKKKISSDQDIEKEWRHKKKKADQEWDEMFSKILLGIVINRSEIITRMEICNLTDGCLLTLGYKI